MTNETHSPSQPDKSTPIPDELVERYAEVVEKLLVYWGMPTKDVGRFDRRFFATTLLSGVLSDPDFATTQIAHFDSCVWQTRVAKWLGQ